MISDHPPGSMLQQLIHHFLIAMFYSFVEGSVTILQQKQTQSKFVLDIINNLQILWCKTPLQPVSAIQKN